MYDLIEQTNGMARQAKELIENSFKKGYRLGVKETSEKYYEHGYIAGKEAGRKEAFEEAQKMTFAEHYEKLVREIRESVTSELLRKIEEHYEEQV